MFKTKIERRKYWEAQQAAKALEMQTEIPTEEPRCGLAATQAPMTGDLTATLTDMPGDQTAEAMQDRVESEHDVAEDINDVRAPSGDLLTVSNISSAVS